MKHGCEGHDDQASKSDKRDASNQQTTFQAARTMRGKTTVTVDTPHGKVTVQIDLKHGRGKKFRVRVESPVRAEIQGE